MIDYKISPLGDQALILQFGDLISIEANQFVHLMKHKIEEAHINGIIELVPAFHTLTIHYNPLNIDMVDPYNTIKTKIIQLLNTNWEYNESIAPTVKIPVCYDTEYGLDLSDVASTNGLTKNEVIDIHTSNLYQVFFIGFSPGFPFLGGMDSRISTPRKSSPRLKVPAGSVGIAGNQTGIYPMETPGGWQIIGRTPVKLFNPEAVQPTLLQPGDKVEFYPITKKQYKNWDDEQWV